MEIKGKREVHVVSQENKVNKVPSGRWLHDLFSDHQSVI